MGDGTSLRSRFAGKQAERSTPTCELVEMDTQLLTSVLAGLWDFASSAE